VPYMLSLTSATTPPCGFPSSQVSKLCTTFSVQVLLPSGVILKTVPQPPFCPHVPPNAVVPYRFPALSMVTPSNGTAPSVPPLKSYSTLYFG
jgi:hypothetical protein